MSGDVHVRFWESAGVRFPRATHLPLNRQQTILARHGLSVSRSTTCDWLRGCAAVLDPLHRLMLTRVKASHAIHLDDTPVSLLAPRRTAYAWVVIGDGANPYTVFDLTPGRGAEHPERLLAGFTGFVHADAYAGYHEVHAGDRHVGCWMHVRRGFHDVRDQDPRAVDALAVIRTLYAVERTAKDRELSDAAVSQHRREHARPILDQFADWLAEQHRVALPKSGFGQAVSYAVNQWPTLVRYVGDGRLGIDNGPAERAIRPLAVGRNNWLFIGGDGGLHSAAVLLSVVATAKRHGLNPWAYLRDVLTACPHDPPTPTCPTSSPTAGRHPTPHRPPCASPGDAPPRPHQPTRRTLSASVWVASCHPCRLPPPGRTSRRTPAGSDRPTRCAGGPCCTPVDITPPGPPHRPRPRTPTGPGTRPATCH